VKRRFVSLDTIAEWHNVASAAHRAACGKHQRQDVRDFFSRYEGSLERVRDALLTARLPHGIYRAFEIHDPKRRIIHAAPFPDRVAHHALMGPLARPLDDWQVPSSFACRAGKGSHAAVVFAQRQSRRFAWYLKMDVRGYFDHIDHARLLALLCRRLRGEGLFRLIEAVLVTYQTRPGRGLPIGALTSQHFANLYLTPADRWLIGDPRVQAHCRYMDDTVVWCATRADARRLYAEYSAWLQEAWALELKPAIIQQSRLGLSFCGYRVHPHRLRPGRRRLRRFAERLGAWQLAYVRGEIGACSLQQNTDALLAMLQPGRSWHWRRQHLSRISMPEV
jgi:hypothetical protein